MQGTIRQTNTTQFCYLLASLLSCPKTSLFPTRRSNHVGQSSEQPLTGERWNHNFTLPGPSQESPLKLCLPYCAYPPSLCTSSPLTWVPLTALSWQLWALCAPASLGCIPPNPWVSLLLQKIKLETPHANIYRDIGIDPLADVLPHCHDPGQALTSDWMCMNTQHNTLTSVSTSSATSIISALQLLTRPSLLHAAGITPLLGFFTFPIFFLHCCASFP